MPWLACMTRMSVFKSSETLTITPLRTFPVIRYLVVQLSQGPGDPVAHPRPVVQARRSPGMATLAAVAVFRRKVRPASRRLTSARSVEPRVP